MELSNNLISQFAKLNSKTNSTSGELVYGTTVMQGSKLFVNIDGSDTITPVVTTSDVKPGERVTVMIKDHSATIMGNITNPSAGTEEMGKVLDEYDTIIAKIGNFELVVADKVSTEQLEAELAIIDNALIGKATIAELNAVKATIKDLDVSKLEADIANINQAIINKADITDLDAIHADIDLLEADVANINTLIGGHLTMDNIQSLVLTSSKVTVDNAFIKDAMIDRISASKINSGIINTNNVTIQSDDGSMLLKGTLQQFKDSAGNVRIQLGKDAKGDFTFVLYGADGKGQILNQNGITASAISDGLIVNSMVSDNANISGEKLDINSVVTEINNGTKTIKSSKILLDEKNQTFDVAFNALSNTVDNIQVGGRNYLRNSDFRDGKTYWKMSHNGTLEIATDDIASNCPFRNGKVAKITKTVGNTSAYMNQSSTDLFELEIGATYTFSGFIYGETDIPVGTLRVGKYDLIDGELANTSLTQVKEREQWTHFEHTFTATHTIVRMIVGIGNASASGETSYNVYAAGLKLEKGNKATDWTIAPEDIDSAINSVDEKVTSQSTQLTVAQGQIQSLISNTTITKENGQTVSLKDDYSSFQQTVNGMSSKLGSLETTVDANNKNVTSKMSTLEQSLSGVSAEVSSVKSTTTTLTTKVDDAQNTANTAKSNAATAQTTANTAKTAATNAQNTANTANALANTNKNNISDLTTTVTTTSSKVTTLEANLSGITQRVSSTETTTTSLATKVDKAQSTADTANSKVDNLQIGGRNYLPNTDFSDSTNLKKWYGSNQSVNSFNVYQGFGTNLDKDSFIRGDYVLRNRYDIAKAISLGTTYAGFKPTEDVVLEKNTEYTISFYMYKSSNCGKCYMTIFPVLDDGSLGTKCGGTSSITEYTGAFERYEVTFTTNAESNKYSVRFYNYHKDTLTSGYSDVHIYHPMLVKGNKAMDWSISPDDLQEQIDTHTTEITTTKSQIASVETNLDKITSRVESVETTSIENFNNLLINSNIKNGTTGWRLTNLVYGTSVRNAITSYRAPDRNAIMIGDLNDLTSKIRFMDSTKFPVFAGEKISMSLHAMTADYVESLQVYLLFTDNTSPIETDNTYFSEYSYIKVSGGWNRYTLTATAPDNATRCFVRIRYVSKEKPTTAENNRGSLCSIMVNRGEKYPTWTANTEDNFKLHETRLSFAESKITDTAITNVVKNAQFVKDMNGNITTNKSNISKIQQTATSITSRVDTLDGKYTELKQTVDGIDITGYVTFSDLSGNGTTTINGANITTGYISGDRIKGGKITATKEINFEGGARMFGNAGEFESGLAISAGGFRFSGGTVNYLSGNWYVIDAGNIVVSDGNISAGGNITSGGIITSGGTIYGTGNIYLANTSIWCPYGSAYRDTLRLGGHLISSDSSGSGYLLILDKNGEYSSLRAHAGSFANDVGCKDVWASNKVYAAGVALTSDESLKTDIRYVDLDPQVLSEDGLMSPNVNITTQDMHSFIETMPMISYRMKQDIANDIDYTYYGFVAQDILYTKVGSELIENDTLKETEIVVDENGENIEVTTERDILRFSVNKFVSFICGALQEEIRQRKALERQLNELMDTINK